MKKISLLILIITCFYASLNAQWIIQNSGTGEALHDVEFINQYTGWICGDGYILKTTNAGQNWVNQNHPASDKFLYSIHPVNENLIYCVGWFETILKSTNGGTDWTALRNGLFGEGNSYFACFFIDENTGWIGGSGLKMWKTTNGGLTFDSIFVSVGYIYDIYFKNSLEGLLCGNGGHVRKTTDGGQNWLGVNIPLGTAFPDFRKISVVDDSYVWLVGNVPRVFRSTDFGSNWQLLDTIDVPGSVDVYCVEFSNQNTGWAGGTFGYLYKTTDSGFTWLQEQTNGDQRFFGSMWFYNDTIGWGVGGAGKIFHTTTGGQTLVNISNHNENIPDDFILNQNYPNPFNPETTIEFSIPLYSYVSIKIYNILGKEVRSEINKSLISGKYKLALSMKEMSSGIYYYSLNIDGINRQQKKMVLIK